MPKFITPIDVTPDIGGWVDIELPRDSYPDCEDAAGVVIRIVNTGDEDQECMFRKNGSTDGRPFPVGPGNDQTLFIGVDCSVIFEVQIAEREGIAVFLEAYFPQSKAEFHDNAIDMSFAA